MSRELSSSPPVTALAPGFRFHPTDEELVRYYLTRKVCGKNFRFDAIAEADIYKMEPWDLPGLSRLQSRDLEWYFFSALDKKYGNGARMNRATVKGYWKATGNDRSVRHESRTVGMKKTLVFHKGRAPGGKRTNWVMHEYRLVDEELEKSGFIKDGYVLCRVFQKSGLGPPNGDQYAPFIEDEWDDDQPTLLPGTEGVRDAIEADEGEDGDGACFEGHDAQQATQSEKIPLHQLERDLDRLPFVCKNEKLDDWPLPSIVRNKRPRYIGPNPSHSNASKSSSTATLQDLSLSTTSTMTAAEAAAEDAAATTTAVTTAARTLLEFPLLESIEHRGSPSVPPPSRRFDIGTFDISVHPSYLELINNLQKEIHNISSERETLKIEVMSAQTMINILQSRIDSLVKENEELKRID